MKATFMFNWNVISKLDQPFFFSYKEVLHSKKQNAYRNYVEFSIWFEVRVLIWLGEKWSFMGIGEMA